MSLQVPSEPSHSVIVYQSRDTAPSAAAQKSLGWNEAQSQKDGSAQVCVL